MIGETPEVKAKMYYLHDLKWHSDNSSSSSDSDNHTSSSSSHSNYSDNISLDTQDSDY